MHNYHTAAIMTNTSTWVTSTSSTRWSLSIILILSCQIDTLPKYSCGCFAVFHASADSGFMHPVSDLAAACPKCFTGYIVHILLILLACITIPILTPSTVRNNFSFLILSELYHWQNYFLWHLMDILSLEPWSLALTILTEASVLGLVS